MVHKKRHNIPIRQLVILGHDGFIGNHLVSYCREKNPFVEITGFSKSEVDLTKINDVQKISKSFKVRCAIIMLSCIKPNKGDSRDAFFKNISMVGNLCQVLQNHPVARFIYMSSAAVYGEDVHNTNISEATPVLPRSYYGLAKYTSERLLWKTFDDQKRSGLIVLRPPVIYGLGEGTVGYNPAGFLQTVIFGNPVTLWGNGGEKREFIYVEDMVKIIHYFIYHQYTGVLNIASGTSYSFAEITSIIGKLLGKKITIRTKKRSRDKVDNIFNNKLLQKIIPNFRFTTLTEAIVKLIEISSLS